MSSASITSGFHPVILQKAVSGDASIHIADAQAQLMLDVPSVATVVVHIEDSVEQFECEMTLAARSSLTIVFVHTSKTPFVFRQRTSIADNATLQLLNVSLGSDLAHELQSVVIGEHAISSVDWIAYAKAQEKQKISVRNIFNGRQGGGEVTMRAVAEQKGAIDIRGLIDIGEGGGATDTYLTQQVLMLDPTAKIDASPALEIKTNDVKASHSASVSRVTPEDLHYFSARGIDPTEAKGLLVKGFLGELVQRINSPETVAFISQAIEKKYAAK